MATARKATKAAAKKPAAKREGGWTSVKCTRFAKLLAEGMTQAQAFVAVYPPAKHWTKRSLEANSSKRANDPRVVSAREAFEREARDVLVAQGAITLENHLSELAKLRDLAAAAKDYGSAVRAEERRGMVAGFYVEKKQVAIAQTVTHVDRAVSEVDAILEDALGPGQTYDHGVDGEERSLLPSPLPPEAPRH